MQWKWKGPVEGGITQSLIQKFLECPYCFVLYYGLGLEESTILNQNLLWGNLFHKGLEIALPRKENMIDIMPEILTVLKEEQKQWPYINLSTIYSVRNMLLLYDESFKYEYDEIVTEKQFREQYRTKVRGVPCSLMGKIDGLATHEESGRRVLLEHKTKGYYDKMSFRHEAEEDVQVNLYCHITDVREIIYDNILIPETSWNAPQPHVGERMEHYINRIYKLHKFGNYPVEKNSLHWLDQYSFSLEEEEHQLFMKTVIDPQIEAITMLYDYTNNDSFDPHNPDCYNHLFHKRPLRMFDPARTDKFKKNYYNLLTDQIGLENLVPVKELFKELKGEG